MIILLKLILAHFIGDFLLQPKSWVEKKEQHKIRSIKFYIHIILHGVLVLMVLWDFTYWLLALMIMLLHGLIDVIKLYAQKEETKPKWFFLDQVLHLVSIIALWGLWFNPRLNFDSWHENPTVWILATALIFITTVSGIVIQIIMSNWSKSLNEGNKESLNSAGKYIGILERLFVFTFVITGHWEAIGFFISR